MRRRVVLYGTAAALLALAVVLALAGFGQESGKLTDWQAFTLGLVQGFTELLPISSSGHLILVPWIGQWRYLEEHPDFNKTFDVALHLGTLVAVVVYFWDDVVAFTVAWFRSVGQRAIADADEKIAWLVFFATIPAALAGALGEETIEKHLGAAVADRDQPRRVRRPALGRRPQRPVAAASKTRALDRRSSSAAPRCSRSCRASRGRGSRSRPAAS